MKTMKHAPSVRIGLNSITHYPRESTFLAPIVFMKFDWRKWQKVV